MHWKDRSRGPRGPGEEVAGDGPPVFQGLFWGAAQRGSWPVATGLLPTFYAPDMGIA
jgi:hypothetical protein